MENNNLQYIDNWKITFGKYKDILYRNLEDKNYIRWLLDNNVIKNEKINQYLKQKIIRL